jgi:L-xylulose reductase
VRLGANVIGVSRSAGPLSELKQEMNGKSFTDVQLDLADWKKTRDTLQSLDVKIDGIVNNAGIAVIKPFSELTEEDFDQVMNVNLKGEKVYL